MLGRAAVEKIVAEKGKVTLKKIRKPEFFYALLQKARHPGIWVIPDPDKPEINHLGAFRDQLSQVQRMWPDVRIEILICVYRAVGAEISSRL